MFNDPRYQAFLAQIERQHRLPRGMLRSIANAETGHIKDWNERTQAVSNKGATGVFQFMPGTGARYGLRSPDDFRDPFKSAQAAGAYLGELSRMFNGRPDLMAAAYNAGEHNSSLQKGQVPNIPETKKYVGKVMGYLDLPYDEDPFWRFRPSMLIRGNQRIGLGGLFTGALHGDNPNRNVSANGLPGPGQTNASGGPNPRVNTHLSGTDEQDAFYRAFIQSARNSPFSPQMGSDALEQGSVDPVATAQDGSWGSILDAAANSSAGTFGDIFNEKTTPDKVPKGKTTPMPSPRSQTQQDKLPGYGDMGMARSGLASLYGQYGYKDMSDSAEDDLRSLMQLVAYMRRR